MFVIRHAIACLIAVILVGCSPASPTASPPAGSEGPRGPDATFHAAADLEARMPGDAAGVALTIESVLGTGFESSRPHGAGLRCRWYQTRGLRCRDQAGLTALLSRLGRSPADVSIAVAYDRTRGATIEVQALHVTGSNGQQVLDAQLAVEDERSTADGGSLDVTTLELAGRTLTVIRPARAYPLGEARYLLPSGDVLYEIRKTDEQTLESVLGNLP